MLDQFRALGAGDDHGRRNARSIGLWNRVLPLVVAPAAERLVDLPQQGGTPFVIASQHNAIGVQKVGDSAAFAKELRVRRDVEGVGRRAIA